MNTMNTVKRRKTREKKENFHCLWQYNLNVVYGEATAKKSTSLYGKFALYSMRFFSNLFAYPLKKVLPEHLFEIKNLIQFADEKLF